MTFAKYYKQMLLLPAFLAILSIAFIAMWGLKPSIDLVGGSLLQINYPSGAPSISEVQQIVAPLNLGKIEVQSVGQNGFQLSQRSLSNDEKNELETVLGGLGTVQEVQFTSIGPSIGADLLHKALLAIGLVILCIIAFIAFAFRKVSEPVASWKYGVVAIVSLAHDILIPTGLFALLGYISGAQVDSLFIVGLLTILGISINDKIVVFDRIRENLRRNADTRQKEQFEMTVGRSVTQTIARSINTSLTVVVVLAALYFVGPASTQYLALTLLIGMIAGTYSSIMLAAPLLIVWEKYDVKRSVVAKNSGKKK